MKLRSTRNFDLRIRGILRKNPSLAEEVRDVVKQVVAGENLEGLRIHKDVYEKTSGAEIAR